jgi:hypothetical protein
LKPGTGANLGFKAIAEAFGSGGIQIDKSHLRMLPSKCFYHSSANTCGTASNKYTASRKTGVTCTFAHWTTSYIDERIIIFAGWRRR